MTAANVNSAAGTIIGQWRFISPEMGYIHAFTSYSGTTPSTAWFSINNIVDPMGAQQTGQTTSEFRSQSFNVLDRIRRHIMDLHNILDFLFGGSSSRLDANALMSYIRSSTYRSRLHSADTGSNGLKVANAASELIRGFIPEWGNGTTTANLNAKASAVAKMSGLGGHDVVVEHAKALRREKNQSIRFQFDEMIRLRNAGFSASTVIKKLI
jgi:hypothetical protein